MALIETWLNCDTTKLVTVKALDGNVFNADNEGNLIGVYVSKKGQPVELSGSVMGYVIRPDGGTVTVPGSLSGNRAWIVLPQSAYAVIGQISIAIRLVNGSEKTVLAACTGYVNRTTTDTIIDPGHVIPSLDELLAQIEACETATTAATAAAGAANTAASNADAKAALANTAAGNADAKATLANTAAGRADDAAAALENMTATATGLAAGASPTVSVTEENGHYLVEFGIPKGDTGEVTQAEFDALDEKVDQKAPAVFKTIESTPIATFADGADDMPLKDLKVAIEPVQDLHGYDRPWPAGGGKNKFDFKTVYSDTSKFTINGESVTGTASNFYSAQVHIPASMIGQQCTFSAKISTGADTTNMKVRIQFADTTVTNGNAISSGNTGVSSVTFTPTSTDDFVCIAYGSGGTGINVVSEFQLESGSTATDYSPYSNICPITGWTGAKVTRTGKNLFGGVFDTKYNLFIHANNTFTVSAKKLASGNLYFAIYNKSGVVIDYWYINNESGDRSYRTFTLPYDIYGVRIYNTQATDIQLEIGSTASAYEPYQGQTYDITFPDSAGTIYGGTLDAVSGVLTVDRAMVDLGTLIWAVYGSYADMDRYVTSGIDATSTDNATNAICTIYPYRFRANGFTIGSGVSKLSVLTEKGQYSDIDTFKSAMSGVMLCYPLVTPVTYQLTPQEVITLLGLNNIWADTGDINLLTYPADTAIKVENVDQRITSVLSAIVAPVLTDMIADTALAVNQFRIVNDTLYKVTAPIASGGILTPGTNVIATSIGEQITALLNA